MYVGPCFIGSDFNVISSLLDYGGPSQPDLTAIEGFIENMWIDHKDFNGVVKSSWRIPALGSSLQKFSYKLKRLQVEIQSEAATFFEGLLVSNSYVILNSFLDCIPSLISWEDNLNLPLDPTLEEVRNEVFHYLLIVVQGVISFWYDDWFVNGASVNHEAHENLQHLSLAQAWRNKGWDEGKILSVSRI
ncbi:hypothetical protein ACH5RR_040884 [Cinchona calisaya]|uniref:Uncharacterized protein n=1 Tax=Cinchona calisaya TaxID=153742 RepID=A0ABD2XX65_9GENT